MGHRHLDHTLLRTAVAVEEQLLLKLVAEEVQAFPVAETAEAATAEAVAAAEADTSSDLTLLAAVAEVEDLLQTADGIMRHTGQSAEETVVVVVPAIAQN